MKLIKRGLSFLLAFILMLFMFGTVVSTELATLTGNSHIYKKIACSDSITERQMTVINSRINELASEYGFDPDSVRGLITYEGLQQYAGQCTDWWMNLLNGTGNEAAPVWPYENIMNAVREDEKFTASVEKYEQRTVARDKVAVPLTNTIRNCVLCVRSELIDPLSDKVNERFDLKYYSRVLNIIPWICGLMSLLIAGLIILITPGVRSRHCIGYAFGAVAFLLIIMIVVIRAAGIQAMIAEASDILSEQSGAFLNVVTIHLLIPMIVCICAYIFFTLKGKKKVAEVPEDHC